MRIHSLKIIVACCFVILAVSFFQKQILSYSHYKRLSEKNRIRVRSIAAPRGLILDKKGVVLAGNRISFDVAVIPQEMENQQATFALLEQTLNRPVENFLKNYKKNYTAPFAPVVIVKDITREEAIKLEERSIFLPGVIVMTTPVRYYPQREAASHFIGYLGEINSDELSRLKAYGYRIKEAIGKDGLEKNYDGYLKGEAGGVQIEVDNRGREVRTLGLKSPKKGNDIQLTVDSRIQQQVYELMKNYTGAVTVINPHTGEILAMCSSPGFDPNIFIERDNAAISSLLNNSKHPLLNRNIQAVYPPGSIFKILIASAALQEHKITRYTPFVCSGSFKLGRASFACWNDEGHGQQTVVDALRNSCNVFFYNTGLVLGVDLIYKYAEKFGLTRITGIDLPCETRGIVPNQDWKRRQLGQSWYKGDTVNYSIGQGYLCATPLQILRMVCVVANGGKLVKPFLVKKIGDVPVDEPAFEELGFDEKNLEVVRQGMEEVAKAGGTGHRVAVEGLSIAGKTGTAQANGGTHAWFAGYAPAKNPKIAIIVLLEHGGHGGLAAVDVARGMFSFIKENYDIEMDF